MRSLKFPPDLLPAAWDKLKGLPSADQGFGDALRKLDKLYRALDAALLDTDALKAADEVRERLRQIDAALKGPVRAAREQATATVAAGRKLEAALKKLPATPKPTLAALARTIDAADTCEAQTPLAFEEVQTLLAKLLARLDAQADKDDEMPANGDFRAFAKPRVVSALRLVRKNPPEAAPLPCLLVEGNKHAAAYVAPSVSTGQRDKLIALLKERGDTSFKFFRAVCLWEEQSYTFVGDTLPLGGFAKRLKEGLLDLTGLKYKLRVRRSSGEVDDAGGEADPDPEAGVAADGAPAPAADRAAVAPDTLAAAFAARLAALQPRLRAALDRGGAPAEALRGKVGEAAALAAQKRFEPGLVLLDALEALLLGPPTVASPATAQDPAPPAADSADATLAFRARLGALVPQLREAERAAGPLGQNLQSLREQAVAAARQKDLALAQRLLDEIERLLGSAAGAAAAGATAALAPIWAEAKATIDRQLTTLQDTLRRSGLEVLEQVADELGSALGRFRVELPAALLDVDQAGAATRAAARRRALEVVASYRAALSSDPHVEAADTNPFGVQVTIRETLGLALQRLESRLSADTV